MDLQLTDKVVLVTAASRGIGYAVAERFAAEGARVVISSRSATSLKEAATKIGGGATSLVCDLTEDGAGTDLVERVVTRAGRLDILVSNTPGPRIAPALETTDDDWSAAYAALLRPAVQLSLRASRYMCDQGEGSIVFLTSTWVKQPAKGGVLSATMRSGVSALSKQLALELAPAGVRVNQVMPGATSTDRMRDIMRTKAAQHDTTEDEERAETVREIPVGRMAEPGEIANAVVFLASPLSSFTTGLAVYVDGGAVRSTL
jgi:3-oxoacyl-[acyl-carrier protein] reductase